MTIRSVLKLPKFAWPSPFKASGEKVEKEPFFFWISTANTENCLVKYKNPEIQEYKKILGGNLKA